MDTSAERKKRKRENNRDVADRVRKCRAKKKKLKEDLLIKNYKNREAVRKHRSGIKHAGTRGKYKPRKTQYDEYGSPVTPAEKKMYQGLFKRTWYADGTRVQKKRFYKHMMRLNETDPMVIKMSGRRFEAGEKIMLKENPNEVGVIRWINRKKKKAWCAFPSNKGCSVVLSDLIHADTVNVRVLFSPKKKDSLPPKHLAVFSPVTKTIEKIRYTDQNILHNPQLLGLSKTPCKSFIISKNGQQKIIYSDKNRTEYVGDTTRGKPHGKGTEYIPSQQETYVGDFKNGKKHGNGKLTYYGGGGYEGQWKNDEYHGEGIYSYSDGMTINGKWKESCKYGKCIISAPKCCSEFEAEFKYGIPKGVGKSICINNHSYTQYTNGSLTVNDSNRYYKKHISDFMKGKFNCKGDFVYENSWEIFMNGMVKQKFDDGRMYSGMFQLDCLHGIGTYKWPNDYKFSSSVLKDHDIKFVELTGRFETGCVVEGELKLNIGDSTASIKFENVKYAASIKVKGVKYELWQLAREVIGWYIDLPKLTRRCAMCQELLYTKAITYSTESQTIKTKEEVDRFRVPPRNRKGHGIVSIRNTYPYVTLPVQRLPHHGRFDPEQWGTMQTMVLDNNGKFSHWADGNEVNATYQIEMPPCCKSCYTTEEYLEKIHKLKDIKLEYLEKRRKEFYQKYTEAKDSLERHDVSKDWDGMSKQGYGRQFVSANAYNKSNFSFTLV